MKVKVKLLTPTAKLPTKAHTTDACFDIYADCKTEDSNTRNYIIEPGNWCNIHTGISTEIPVGYFAAVYGRSGMGIKQHLRPSNCVGIIDADYRGEWMVCLHNDGKEVMEIKPGDRSAQFCLQEVLPVELVPVEEELTSTERSTDGFGSTGR